MFDRYFIFAKAQVSSFVGGVVDYLVMVFFTEVFNIHYTISIGIGGVIGAIVNFSLNKTWTFRAKDCPYRHSLWIQLFRFALTVLNSIFIKSMGTYFLTTFIRTDYRISRVMVDLAVSLIFNYTLQKHWVFSKKHVNTQTSVREAFRSSEMDGNTDF